MALKFDIKPTQDCGVLKYTNCSTYCDGDNFITKALIASIVPNLKFFGDSILQITTDIYNSYDLSSITWEVNGGSPISTNINQSSITISSSDFVQGINSITMTVEDVEGNISILNFAFETDTSNNIVWYAIPDISITTNQTLSVQFADNSHVDNITVDSLQFLPDNPNSPTFTDFSIPINHTYDSDGLYEAYLEFDVSPSPIAGETVSLLAILNIEEDTTDCSSQLTESDISSVALIATSPSNISYTADITSLFLTNNFNVTTSMFGITSDSFETGIWTFQTIVTKTTNTGTHIFAYTIKLVLFCKEQCAFNAYVAQYSEEEIDCCAPCKEEKEKKIILMSTYIDAIKNASACGELTKITKFINLLQRLLSNKNCNC